MERKSQRSAPCQKATTIQTLNQKSIVNSNSSQNKVTNNKSCPVSPLISHVVGSNQNTKIRLRAGITPTLYTNATATHGKSHHHHNHQQQIQNVTTKNNNTATGLYAATINKGNNGTAIATVAGQLLDINAKALAVRNKNEEAIQDLRTRIPEIENIFDIKSRIGNGTFSTVLLATLKKERQLADVHKRKFAIKHHIPTSHPERIMKELQCMAKIGGSNNVVGINCCIRFNESVAFIMPYMQHDRFQDFYGKMDLQELQQYMKNLLIALRHVHKFNVIHRDVKPSNFLYNRRKRQFLLVDFGLAQQVPLSLVQQQLQYGTNCGNLSNNECKRVREPDDSNNISIKTDYDKVNATNADTMANDAKRQRCTGPQGDQVLLNGSSNSGNNFKMPLKQINEISNTANNNNSTNINSNYNSNNNTKLNENSIINNNNSSNNNNNNAPSSSNNNKYNTNRNLSATNNASKCHCYGNPQVCNTCLVKKEIHASRAGTPGYRPPEVLMKYADQTTAVDVWAAGVILLSILSSVYPFFKANTDYIALAEMVTIFGDKAIRRTAFALDRLVSLSQHTKPLNLRKLCVRFRNRQKFSSSQLLKKYQNTDGSCEVCKNCDQYFFNCLCADSPYDTEPMENDDPFPESAYDLLSKLLEVNPHQRITADEALKHAFFAEITTNKSTEKISTNSTIANNAVNSAINSKT